MKKLLLVIVALFAMNSAFSQNVKFGFKAGGNLSYLSPMSIYASMPPLGSFSMNLFKNDGMQIGFHAGAFANISFGKIAFQPELLFSMQGGKQKLDLSMLGDIDDIGEIIEIGDLDELMKFTLSYNYIYLPLLFEYKPIANLGILVGPQFGLNIYKSMTAAGETMSGSDIDAAMEEALGLTFNKFDVGLVFGLQYYLTNNIHVGLRYNLGLTNSYSMELPPISDGGYTMTMGIKGWKNNILQLSVGYSF